MLKSLHAFADGWFAENSHEPAYNKVENVSFSGIQGFSRKVARRVDGWMGGIDFSAFDWLQNPPGKQFTRLFRVSGVLGKFCQNVFVAD